MLSRVIGTPPVPASRRAFLALGTLGVAGTFLAGCSTVGGAANAAGTATGPAGTTTDTAAEEEAVSTLVAQVQALHRAASDLGSGVLPNGAALRIPGATARLLRQIADVHAGQLEALGSPVAPTTPTAVPTATATTQDDNPGVSPAALTTAEWEVARVALSFAGGLSPAFALLLFRIAASCAANADLLRATGKGKSFGTLTVLKNEGSSDPTETTETVETAEIAMTAEESAAINRLLAGEHAAFYAYPLVIAHVGKGRRKVATSLWEAHRQQRDQLERLLLAADEEPVEAGAAYEVRSPGTGKEAAALAGTVEQRLAGLAVGVIAAAESDTVESAAADLLVLSTRRQAAWTNRPVADPGAGSTSGEDPATPVP